MSSMPYRDRLLDATLSVLWAHWTELGVGGVAARVNSVVDPEALLLATARFGRYDPRLFDEALDWLSRFSDSLDVTRLRRLARGGSADARVLAALTDFLHRRSTAARWEVSARSMIAREERAVYAGAMPLFFDDAGAPLPTFGEKDGFFLEHGLERPPLELRGMSVAPDLRRPSLSRLRLRALLGSGVRAEVMLYLATHDSAHGRLIATRAGFSQRQVFEYLNELAAAGFAERWEEGRTVQFRLAEPLGKLMQSATAYVDWPALWGVVSALWDTLARVETSTSEYEAAKEWRAGLQLAGSMVPVEGFGPAIPAPERYPGESVVAYAEVYVAEVAELLRAVR